MKKIFVELADTPIKRQQGLMGRKRLGANEGMLFKFPHYDRLVFWMSNTYIPLDIAFVDDEEKIFQIEEMVPLSTKKIESDMDCCYALEVNKGWFSKNNVNIGSKVKGLNDLFKNARRIPHWGIVEGQAIDPLGNADVGQVNQVNQINQIDSNPPVNSELEDNSSINPELEDVQVNMTYRDIIEDANIRGNSLIMVYTKKDNFTLPPKIISPPFLFGTTMEGKVNGLITCWDEQDATWKSFLIDNIIDLEKKR
ncbi:MAG: DUF192 domain-containing protein [bacterium]